MNTHVAELVNVDWTTFDPWVIQPVRHQLMEHSLLQLSALVELGKRLEASGRVRTHSGSAKAETSFNDAPQLHPNRMSAVDTLEGIGDANAWMSLLNVQSDPIYRTLVDEVLDDLKPGVDQFDPGMCYRGGWIFVTSPHAVTPFHFDKEHNFLLQLRGHKRLYVWDHRDTAVVSEHARDHFHRTHSRELLHWREEFRERAQVFDLTPGMGAYMPSTSPHMVENGDEPSITMSFTYYTKATRNRALLHRTHDMMRGIGWTPPAVGRFPILDGATAMAARVYAGTKRVGRRMVGAPVSTDAEPYAKASGS
ncbi:MAG: cupin-like domain-containing protein [Rhodanobacter sp.]